MDFTSQGFIIIRLREHERLTGRAADWFSEKWGIPVEVYADSIKQCQRAQFGVPQWYVVMDADNIIAGCGVIENDFHPRKDLTPNVCAVYVESEYRSRGIAGEMLKFAA